MHTSAHRNQRASEQIANPQMGVLGTEPRYPEEFQELLTINKPGDGGPTLAGRSLSMKPFWTIEQVPGETLS